jgi:hypothetical protein
MAEIVNKITRENILAFEQEVSKLPGVVFGDSDMLPLKHSFADGMYVREMFIPKGHWVIGKIHKHSHPSFLMKGKILVITEQGKQVLDAPLTVIAPAGTKRIGIALEDTIWVTCHATKETDLDKIEEDVIVKSFEEFDQLQGGKLCLLQQ